MVTRSYILANLKNLDRNYRHANSAQDSLFYSKLAILELCGWIEESMDDIIIRCANRHLKNRDNKNFVDKQIIKCTYGFDYEKHFRIMLVKLLGIINVERIEKNVDQNKLSAFKAALENLKKQRDPEAHTHIKGTTKIINAPSVTMAQFPTLYDGLIEIDSKLKVMTI